MIQRHRKLVQALSLALPRTSQQGLASISLNIGLESGWIRTRWMRYSTLADSPNATSDPQGRNELGAEQTTTRDSRRNRSKREPFYPLTAARQAANKLEDAIESQGPNARSQWDHETDKTIIRLFNAKTAWKEIDRLLGRPTSSCYYRYFTALDPNLQLCWNFSDGRPNRTMLQRLLYLVDEEKLVFSEIEKNNWMWKRTKKEQQDRRRSAAIYLDESIPRVLYNKVSLQKKYRDEKLLQDRKTRRQGEEQLSHAIQRSVEMYGENWVKVAAHSEKLLKKWSQNGIPVSEQTITPAFAASYYRTMHRQGVDWGLEDDVVMTRKVLAFGKDRADILDVLALPLRDQSIEGSLNYWKEISISLGSHTPAQCKRRWDGLWSLKDEEKTAQSRSWHRYEQYQFWMLWKEFYLKTPLPDPESRLQDVEAICSKYSFVKQIAPWMRHRNENRCELMFRSTVNSMLSMGLSKNMVEGDAEKQQLVIERYQTKGALLDSVLKDVAEANMAKLSIVSQASTKSDPHQNIIRSDWTKSRIATLREIVMKAKQGVQRADFELDWDRIASTLEKQLGEDCGFSAKQCKACWSHTSTWATVGEEWSEHEIGLLQQGVRRWGTSWADIRAQFLPHRGVTELHQQWATISEGQGSDKVVDRLREPDYVGLMSALDKLEVKKAAGSDTLGQVESQSDLAKTK